MPVGNAPPASCARDEFRVANNRVPRMSARDQLVENLRRLGISGMLNVRRSGYASGMISSLGCNCPLNHIRAGDGDGSVDHHALIGDRRLPRVTPFCIPGFFARMPKIRP